jgi:putative hydrolase of the HAD superfamily
MREVLEYGKVFDRLFFSCEIGCSKPNPSYFTAILDALKIAPHAVLFIDDVEANVAAASSVGIRAELFAPESPAEAVAEMHRILFRHGLQLS